MCLAYFSDAAFSSKFAFSLCEHSVRRDWQRCTGSGFQDSSPAGFSTFSTNRIGPDYGFIQVSWSGWGFSNFIVLGFDANTIIKRMFANLKDVRYFRSITNVWKGLCYNGHVMHCRAPVHHHSIHQSTISQRWARIRTGSDCFRTEVNFGWIRSGSDWNFFEIWRIRTGSDWKNFSFFNVIILNIQKISLVIRFYRFVKW